MSPTFPILLAATFTHLLPPCLRLYLSYRQRRSVLDYQNEYGPSPSIIPLYNLLTAEIAERSAKHDALNCRLENNSIHVWDDFDGPSVVVTFRRTIRVPDNDGSSELPPDLGEFPLFPTSKYAKRMPAELVAKGGAFFPMYRKLFFIIQLY